MSRTGDLIVDCLSPVPPGIDLKNTATPNCPGCGGHEWGPISFLGSTRVSQPSDVGDTPAKCGCGWVGRLDHLLDPAQRIALNEAVRRWMYVTVNVPPTSGFVPPTEASLEKAMKYVGRGATAIFHDDAEFNKVPESEYKCEADKPEGTRDVDKFLKEQQNKLWGVV